MNTIAQNIHKNLPNTFSYGETLAIILEHNGTPISNLPNEDFMFPDKSILRLSNNECKILQLLEE